MGLVRGLPCWRFASGLSCEESVEDYHPELVDDGSSSEDDAWNTPPRRFLQEQTRAAGHNIDHGRERDGVEEAVVKCPCESSGRRLNN